MRRYPVPRWTILVLTTGALVLPIAICVIWALSQLLVAMDDAAGGVALRYIAMGGGIMWVVDLICLVVIQGLNSLIDRDDGE